MNMNFIKLSYFACWQFSNCSRFFFTLFGKILFTRSHVLKLKKAEVESSEDENVGKGWIFAVRHMYLWFQFIFQWWKEKKRNVSMLGCMYVKVIYLDMNISILERYFNVNKIFFSSFSSTFFLFLQFTFLTTKIPICIPFLD